MLPQQRETYLNSRMVPVRTTTTNAITNVLKKAMLSD